MILTKEKTLKAPNIEALGLTWEEFSEIKKRLKREPNELELYLFSAMWSEHCGYKHSKKYLGKLPSKKALFRGENSGGIRIGRHVVFFKTESHNHPCAVEPYQGAATGIGGILRDILAMNARPIALLNSLKFGPLKENRNKYLLNGVTEGISDYGNSVGVPTIAGETSFNECYGLSPLVNVMAVGLCKEKDVKKAGAKKDAKIVLIGSATGKDGLFGAAFASKELENSSKDRLSVQIGDPYIKKNVIEATLEILKSKNVYSAQDLGAAGLLSSTSEMAEKGGVSVELNLETVPLREPMTPYEIMLSESQERMVFTCNAKGAEEIGAICKKYEINCAVIGKTLKGKNYTLKYNGETLCSLEVSALTNPLLYTLPDKEPEYIKEFCAKKFEIPENAPTMRELIFKLVETPEFASKNYIYSQYDYTVGARTVQNPHSLGVAPLNLFEEGKIIGFSMDSNEDASFLDPYQGAFNAVYEAARNAYSSGFSPLGITNCLNFGNPENSDVAWQFLRTIDGMKDALETLDIPAVSGNVSFYNEGDDGAGGKLKVHPTPTIGMLSVLKAKKPIYARLQVGDTLFCAGKQAIDATGGSLYQRALYNFLGGRVDTVDINLEKALQKAIFDLSKKRILNNAIDVSKGGILGALLIMLFNSAENTGVEGVLPDNPEALFGEITGRYLFSGDEKIENYLIKNKIPYKKLGKITAKNRLSLGFTEIGTKELKEIYFNSLKTKI